MALFIPEAFAIKVRRVAGARADTWLETLPGLIERLCARWSLEPDGAALHGGLSLVLPVRRGPEAAVLRVALPHGSTPLEFAALRAWNGAGAVRLLDVDLSCDAMLLERLDSRRSLGQVGLPEAMRVLGGLLRQLAIPAPPELPPLCDHARNLIQSLPQSWETLGRPFSQRWLEAALDAARQFGPASERLLVNYDLYDDNVLAGERQPWLVIDPKVIAGDPEFGIAQMLWRRVDQMSGAAEFWRAWEVLLEAANLDAERARAWTRLRIADYWLWGQSIGLTEDPARCERLAGWLL